MHTHCYHNTEDRRSPVVSPRSGLSGGGPPSSSDVSLLLECRNMSWRRGCGWRPYCFTEKSKGCGSSRGRGCCSNIGILSGGLLLLLLLLWCVCCCWSQRRMAADRLRSARAGPSQASSRAPLSSTMMVADAHATHATRYTLVTRHDIDTAPCATATGPWVSGPDALRRPPPGGGTEEEPTNQNPRADKYAHLIKRDWINAIYFPFLIFPPCAVSFSARRTLPVWNKFIISIPPPPTREIWPVRVPVRLHASASAHASPSHAHLHSPTTPLFGQPPSPERFGGRQDC